MSGNADLCVSVIVNAVFTAILSPSGNNVFGCNGEDGGGLRIRVAARGARRGDRDGNQHAAVSDVLLGQEGTQHRRCFAG
ncbi:MAG: hypothetical protein H8E66_18580 [Planctomycetes bacterium]|nr:hypothetical protein [Planctomycetota bacterium]